MTIKATNGASIDLHTHSMASDGTDTPAQLVAKASAAGIKTLALTDHDTIAALGAAVEASVKLGITFVRGCEFSTVSPWGPIHILGLWLPEKCTLLENLFLHIHHLRRERNRRIATALVSQGLDIDSDVIAAFVNGAIGRPRIAQELVEAGYATNSLEAFILYLGPGGSAYVPKKGPRVEEVVEILATIGSIACLAHPFLQPIPPKEIIPLISFLKLHGLAAIEAWHGSQTSTQTSHLVELAQEFNLAISGGSDYHGNARPGIQLGRVTGNVSIPEDFLAKLAARRQ